MTRRVFLIGNQNTGKSTLFNTLTGLRSRVANYPGTTVEARFGKLISDQPGQTLIVDLPGTYSLIPASEEEAITVKALFGTATGVPAPDELALVIDATELRRGLYLYSQLCELGFRPIIILTMLKDKPELGKLKIIKRLEENLGTPIACFYPNNLASISQIKNIISKKFSKQNKKKLTTFDASKYIFKTNLKLDLKTKNLILFDHILTSQDQKNITSITKEYKNYFAQNQEKISQIISSLPKERYQWVDNKLKFLKPNLTKLRDFSDKIDNYLLRPILGSLFLFVIFFGLLQSLFLIAQPIADFINYVFTHAFQLGTNYLPSNSHFKSLLQDGIGAGIGSVLSFLPLIALLFLFLGILEESGYLARATYLLDTILKKSGLCGRSLIPMISGFACAVPAILASRTITNKKERLITILVTPFLTCSARLPVYGLIVGALFSSYPLIWGFIHPGALLFVAMYSLGILASLIAAFILSKILPDDGHTCLAIELPPYRWPQVNNLAKKVCHRIRNFLREVGSVILAATIIIWALCYFEPNNLSPAQNLETSIAGVLGKQIEPLVRPMGLDWQVGVGIIASFLAREVFVSTMGVLYGLETPDLGLEQILQEHISPLSGLCLLIFFTLSLQCVSTLAATRRETQSWFWPLIQFSFMTGSAYLLALIVFITGSSLGYS